MRFASATAAFYCGIDLHAGTMYLVVLDHAGNVRLKRNLPTRPDAFLAAIAPFRPDLVVACECVHTWYWLADRCAAEGIRFLLGDAWGMKAVHGNKTKSDLWPPVPAHLRGPHRAGPSWDSPAVSRARRPLSRLPPGLFPLRPRLRLDGHGYSPAVLEQIVTAAARLD